MLVYLFTPAVRARKAIKDELQPFPLYQEEVLKDFDAMLLGLPTPFFDRCEVVRQKVVEVLEKFRTLGQIR